jgi:hypothetical protein
MALSSFAVNFITTSNLLTTFSPSELMSGTSAYTPAITTDNPSHSRDSSELTIHVALDRPGTIYTVLTFTRRITFDIISGNSEIDIYPAVTPTAEQVLNCRDGYDNRALQCLRVVFMGGETKEAVFSNVGNDSEFVIYYVVANEYPVRPIVVSAVNNFTVLTLLEGIA